MRVRDKVSRLLTANPELRDSDKKLLLAYWEEQGLYLSESQRVTFMGCTIAESITRARRGLTWKFPARKEVQAERQRKQALYKHNESPRAVPWLNEDEED